MHFIEKYIPHHAFFTARRYLQPFASIVTLNALGGNLPPVAGIRV